MTPTQQQDKHPFIDEMKTAISTVQQVAGQRLHPIALEEFLHPAGDQIRFRFWLGEQREHSATYTFTFTSELPVSENLLELEDFATEQCAIATQAPQ